MRLPSGSGPNSGGRTLADLSCSIVSPGLPSPAAASRASCTRSMSAAACNRRAISTRYCGDVMLRKKASEA